MVMTDERKGRPAEGAESGARGDETRDNQEHELEAEQESAEAMDADVPQPGGDGTLTPGGGGPS